MNTYLTRHRGLTSTLRALGQKHLATFVEDGTHSISFEFENPDECIQISGLFFSDEGLAVADARGLLESDRAVRRTMSAAIKSPDGRWENPSCR